VESPDDSQISQAFDHDAKAASARCDTIVNGFTFRHVIPASVASCLPIKTSTERRNTGQGLRNKTRLRPDQVRNLLLLLHLDGANTHNLIPKEDTEAMTAALVDLNYAMTIQLKFQEDNPQLQFAPALMTAIRDLHSLGVGARVLSAITVETMMMVRIETAAGDKEEGELYVGPSPKLVADSLSYEDIIRRTTAEEWATWDAHMVTMGKPNCPRTEMFEYLLRQDTAGIFAMKLAVTNARLMLPGLIINERWLQYPSPGRN